MTVHDVTQRSPEWLALRAGRLCGSRAADMLTKTQKGEWGAGRKNLRAELVLERLTGKPQEQRTVTQAMQDGIDREADALLNYEMVTGTLVDSVGFVTHDELMAGCSPDGVVENFAGIVEAKAPIAATHLEYLKSGKVPGGYMAQITHNLWVTGAEWCDWFSFQPDFPLEWRMCLVRVKRSDVDIEAYDKAARAFLAEVDTEYAALRTMQSPVAVLREVVNG